MKLSINLKRKFQIIKGDSIRSVILSCSALEIVILNQNGGNFVVAIHKIREILGKRSAPSRERIII